MACKIRHKFLKLKRLIQMNSLSDAWWLLISPFPSLVLGYSGVKHNFLFLFQLRWNFRSLIYHWLLQPYDFLEAVFLSFWFSELKFSINKGFSFLTLLLTLKSLSQIFATDLGDEIFLRVPFLRIRLPPYRLR